MPDDDTEHEDWAFARGVGESSGDLETLTDEALRRVRRLSPQARQLLDLLLEGYGKADIAAETGLTPDQVEEAQAGLLDELGAHTTTDAIRIGICADYRQSKDRFVSPD